MNKSFREVANRYVRAAPVLSHKQEATRLYRSSLKCLMAWAIDFEIIETEATKIRADFDKNRNLAQNSGLASSRPFQSTHAHALTTTRGMLTAGCGCGGGLLWCAGKLSD